jgi:hypothetical protein
MRAMKRARFGAMLGATAVLLAVIAVLSSPGGGAARGIRVGQAAPEITGGPWINSEALSLAALKGRVVLVEFWTYG